MGAAPGFTLVELLVGLALALSIALVLLPLWLALERTGARATDTAVLGLQARVVAARFERDLRLAGAADCAFAADCPVLQAAGTQVVFLQSGAEGSPPCIVEWEIADGSLMRRVGHCPASRPSAFAHTLYADNKTMLEHVRTSSFFSYVVNGVDVGGSVAAGDLRLVEAVVLHVAGRVDARGGGIACNIFARVAR